MSLLEKVKKGQTKGASKIMLIGQEGIGKSTAGAQMPSPIFLCAENGLVGEQFNDTPHFTPSSWREALQFIEELTNNPGEFKTLVIDTLDWLEPMIYAHVIESMHKPNIKAIADIPFGKGYELAQNEVRHLVAHLDRVHDAGLNVLILTHCSLRKVDSPINDAYDHYESKVNNKLAGIVKEWCDEILFAHFEVFTTKEGNKVKAQGGTERIVQTTHSAAWDAKNRYGLPEVMELDMREIYTHIVAGKSSAEMLEAIRTAAESMEAKTKEATLKWCESSPAPYAIYEAFKKLNNKGGK